MPKIKRRTNRNIESDYVAQMSKMLVSAFVSSSVFVFVSAFEEMRIQWRGMNAKWMGD